MGRLTPVIQGDADLPGPFATVDRAGDLVAAGMPVQDAVHDMGPLHLASFSFISHYLEVQAALMATLLSGSCAQTLLRACIWWDTSLWMTKSAGVHI